MTTLRRTPVEDVHPIHPGQLVVEQQRAMGGGAEKQDGLEAIARRVDAPAICLEHRPLHLGGAGIVFDDQG